MPCPLAAEGGRVHRACHRPDCSHKYAAEPTAIAGRYVGTEFNATSRLMASDFSTDTLYSTAAHLLSVCEADFGSEIGDRHAVRNRPS